VIYRFQIEIVAEGPRATRDDVAQMVADELDGYEFDAPDGEVTVVVTETRVLP